MNYSFITLQVKCFLSGGYKIIFIYLSFTYKTTLFFLLSRKIKSFYPLILGDFIEGAYLPIKKSRL